MDVNLLLLIVATLLSSAFFSGIEIAFVSADKLHVELQSRKGFITGRIVAKFIQMQVFVLGQGPLLDEQSHEQRADTKSRLRL